MVHDLGLPRGNGLLILELGAVAHHILALAAVQHEDQWRSVFVLHQKGHAAVAGAVAIKTDFTYSPVQEAFS